MLICIAGWRGPTPSLDWMTNPSIPKRADVRNNPDKSTLGHLDLPDGLFYRPVSREGGPLRPGPG
jgi:hypothetical protein